MEELAAARAAIEGLALKYEQLLKLQEGEDAVSQAAQIWATRAVTKKLKFDPVLSDPRALVEIGGPTTTATMLSELPVAKESDSGGREAVTIDFELLGIADTGGSFVLSSPCPTCANGRSSLRLGVLLSFRRIYAANPRASNVSIQCSVLFEMTPTATNAGQPCVQYL